VSVPPGLLQQGDTVDGALDNVREAIELCLEDMQVHGEVIPDPSRVLVGSVVVTQ
jgi:predicted RNase H-like HicB family nuclease